MTIALLTAGVLGSSILTSDTVCVTRDIGIDESTRSHIAKCYFEASFMHIYTIYLGAAILIPLHETLIYPLLYRHSPWIESRYKILVGMVALIARVLTLMAYNVISRHNSLQMNGPNVNVTIPCLFETSKGVLSKSFNYKWMFI